MAIVEGASAVSDEGGTAGEGDGDGDGDDVGNSTKRDALQATPNIISNMMYKILRGILFDPEW